MAAAVRSAVTTEDAPPTPREVRGGGISRPPPGKRRAGVISAPPPIPVSPTMMPTKKAATMIEKKSAVSQSPMGAILRRRSGQARDSTVRRDLLRSGGGGAQPLDNHPQQALHGHRGTSRRLGAAPVGVGDVVVR